MTDATPVQLAANPTPDGGIPRPAQQAPPRPPEREQLIADYTAEWNTQVEWRMHIRDYAAQMLNVVSGNPCTNGVNNWLSDRGMTGIIVNRDLGRYQPGDVEHARQAVRTGIMRTSAPATLEGLPDVRIVTRLEALRRNGVMWRTDLMRGLRDARNDYPSIPRSLVDELETRLNVPAPAAVPAPASAAAPFLEAPAAQAPAPPAAPATTFVEVAVMMRLNMTDVDFLPGLSDENLAAHVRDRLRNTLQRSLLVRTRGVRLDSGGITVLTGVTHAPAQPS